MQSENMGFLNKFPAIGSRYHIAPISHFQRWTFRVHESLKQQVSADCEGHFTHKALHFPHETRVYWWPTWMKNRLRWVICKGQNIECCSHLLGRHKDSYLTALGGEINGWMDWESLQITVVQMRALFTSFYACTHKMVPWLLICKILREPWL